MNFPFLAFFSTFLQAFKSDRCSLQPCLGEALPSCEDLGALLMHLLPLEEPDLVGCSPGESVAIPLLRVYVDHRHIKDCSQLPFILAIMTRLEFTFSFR